MLDSLTAGIALGDRRGYVLSANQIGNRHVQHGVRGRGAADQLPADPVGSGVDPLEARVFADGVCDVLSGDRAGFAIEYPCEGPDGLRWYIGRVTRLAGDGPAQAVVAWEDVTDRRRGDEALRTSERRFRAAFEQSSQPAAVLSPAGDVLETNLAILRLAGATTGFVGRSLWEAALWDGSPETRALLRAAVDEAAAGRVVRHELSIRHTAGASVTLEVVVRPLRDETGEVDVLTFEAHDVSARVQTLRETAEELHENQEIIASIPAVVFTLGLDGRINRCNRKGEEVTGLSIDELRHSPTALFFPPEHAEAINQASLRAFTDGFGEVEAPILHRDGSSIPHIWCSAPLRDASGRVIGLAGVGRDISKRRAVEVRLQEQTDVVEAVLRVGRLLASELDLEKLLQAVTDAVVGLTGAGFGAFFFHSVDDRGGPALRYTAKGIPREVLASLPLPHDNVLFGPVLRGEAVVRLDDLAHDPRSMLSANRPLLPLHPAVASYLAVPVVSPSGQVLGGLLLGHERPGVFKERHEQITVGLAAAAAVALDNARLYRAARQEIAERKCTEEALRESRERLMAALAASETGTFRWDLRTGVIEGDDQLGHFFGRTHSDSGRSVSEVLEWIHPEDRPTVSLAVERCAAEGNDLKLEFRVDGLDGRMCWLVARGRVYRDSSGEPLYLTGACSDITQRKHAAFQLEYQASHDELTGLPNRDSLLLRTEAAVAEARARQGTLALLLIDLDRFKEINDSCGHDYGDLILRQLNPRLRSAVRETDFVARLGGDEFALVLPGSDRVAAVQIAERVMARLVTPIEANGQQFDIAASIGITVYPDHGDNANDLLRHADVAMYAAKRAHSGYEVFTFGQADDSSRRLTRISELRKAIEEGRLLLHYQPKIELATGQVKGRRPWCDGPTYPCEHADVPN